MKKILFNQFNFGNSISDITENNVLRNFIYVFSTGSYVDSLSLEGHVIDAFILSPEKDVLAMLYVNDNDTIPFDSLPYKVKPYYLTRTNENGKFRLMILIMSKPRLRLATSETKNVRLRRWWFLRVL